MSSSPRTIVEINIRHFRKLLETEQDPAKRDMIERRLAEQERMLVALIERKSG